MKWPSLLGLIGGEPVFTSALLLSGIRSAAGVRLQLSRWVKAAKVLQLRRGVYALAQPWRKIEPHPFLVANALQKGSYVSLQSALAFHGLIPEHVPVVTSVGPRRPETVRNDLGAFDYRHIHTRLLFGYSRLLVAPGQHAFVASPEKALLDLIYLTNDGESTRHIASLRLQQPEAVDGPTLRDLAARAGHPRLARAARRLMQVLENETGEPL